MRFTDEQEMIGQKVFYSVFDNNQGEYATECQPYESVEEAQKIAAILNYCPYLGN